MALPPQHVTEQMEILQSAVLQTPLSALLPLTPDDLRLIGTYIQCYNFIELNLRVCVEIFVRAGLLSANRLKCAPTDLVQSVKSALEKDGDAHPFVVASLDEIKLRWPYRNILAHWAARRLPDHDALLFLSRDERDAKQIDGGTVTYGHFLTAIVALADLRGLAIHVIELERWLTQQATEWHERYLGT